MKLKNILFSLVAIVLSFFAVTAKAETTVDFGEDGAEYIVTLYHVLPGGENDGSPDIVSRSLK